MASSSPAPANPALFAQACQGEWRLGSWRNGKVEAAVCPVVCATICAANWFRSFGAFVSASPRPRKQAVPRQITWLKNETEPLLPFPGDSPKTLIVLICHNRPLSKKDLPMRIGNDLADLKLAILAYPLQPAAQAELIRLLRTEWTRTDYDWSEAMHGDYSEALAITSVLARRNGEAVATATVHFARDRPEIAVLGNVLTHRDHRSGGLAGRVIDAALDQARAAQCTVCLLGTSKKPRNVYLRHGFKWQNGVVMRKSLGDVNFEKKYFTAGQSVKVRLANWGDLPGLTLLMTQPLATVCLDYPRGLLSGRYLPLERCLSNYPTLWYHTAARGGMLLMLAEPQTGRIFGFGSVTRAPGAARKHTATVELAAHENYESYLPSMLDHLLVGCRERGIQQAQAFVAAGDVGKRDCLRGDGFTELARLPAALRLSDETRDVSMLSKLL